MEQDEALEAMLDDEKKRAHQKEIADRVRENMEQYKRDNPGTQWHLDELTQLLGQSDEQVAKTVNSILEGGLVAAIRMVGIDPVWQALLVTVFYSYVFAVQTGQVEVFKSGLNKTHAFMISRMGEQKKQGEGRDDKENSVE